MHVSTVPIYEPGTTGVVNRDVNYRIVTTDVFIKCIQIMRLGQLRMHVNKP